MDNESKYILRKVILDFVILVTVAFPILLFYLFGKPFERGFYCDDESLRYPFKESTITSTMLYIIGLGFPIATMMITELIHLRRSRGGAARSFLGRPIHPWLWNSYNVIGIFGFAVACSQLTTDIGKYSIGRLRPHFWSICQPNIICDGSHKYIENFTCSGTDNHKLKEMRLSFPSGHSSFSTCTMLYLVIYIQSRMTWRGSKLLKHLIQFLCIMMAWGTALSRVSDYKHHWSDVLAGAIQGAVVAIIVAVYVSDLFNDAGTNRPISSSTNEINGVNSVVNGRGDSQTTDRVV